jgi:hypothetical protein
MYSIPDFAGSSQTGMTPGSFQMDLGSLGGMSTTENQYMNFPSLTGGPTAMSTPSTSYPPGIVPPSGPGYPVTPPGAGGVGATDVLPGGYQTVPTTDPTFTSSFAQWLQSQLGKGATPFDLSAILPSTGQATAPGTLTAPENPLMQLLNQFYTTGTGGPLPGVLPMWTSEIQSMNIPIQQQLANIKEQFGAQGALGSSEMAQALASFGEQTALQQESLLGQLTLQALPGMQTEAATTQQLDQSAINNLLNEFIRTQPEYSPLLGMESQLAETYPPSYKKGGGVGQALAGSSGEILTGLASLIPALAGLCWISAEVFDENLETGPRVNLVRDYLTKHVEKASKLGKDTVALYRRHGRDIAASIKNDPLIRNLVTPLFEDILKDAQIWRTVNAF